MCTCLPWMPPTRGMQANNPISTHHECGTEVLQRQLGVCHFEEPPDGVALAPGSPAALVAVQDLQVADARPKSFLDVDSSVSCPSTCLSAASDQDTLHKQDSASHLVASEANIQSAY